MYLYMFMYNKLHTSITKCIKYDRVIQINHVLQISDVASDDNLGIQNLQQAYANYQKMSKSGRFAATMCDGESGDTKCGHVYAK